MAAAQYFEQVQKIFIAFYQRPADPAGLKYWAERVDAAGGDINQVIGAFASSPEAVALYGAIDATTDAAAIRTVIDKLYLALFNAADTFDAAGKQFYVDGFMAGTFTAGSIALSVLNGAQNDDLIAVNNKVQVANEFTQQVDGRPMTNAYFGNGTAFNVTYAGDADAVAARGILKNVTFLPSTVISPSAVTEVLKTQIADATDPIQGQTGGQTFTLTTGVDNLTGGAGNDTFNGLAGATAAAVTDTLGAADIINGGAGIDTLNITTTATNTNVLMGAQITGIEVLNIRATAGTASVDASNLAGLTNVNAAAGVGAVTVTNLATGAAIGVVGNGTVLNGATTFGYKTATDAAIINVSGGTTGGNISSSTVAPTTGTINVLSGKNTVGTVDFGTSTAVTSLTVNATGSLAATLATDYAATAALTVAGSAANVAATATAAADTAVNLGAVVGVGFKTIDASGLTAGGLTIGVGTATTSFKGGAGNDIVTTAAVAATAAGAIDAGAGANDILVVGAITDLNSKAKADVFTGFDTLRTLSSGAAANSQDMGFITGSTITAIEIDAGTSTVLSNVTAAQAGAITVREDQATALTLTLKDATGTTDVVNMTLKDKAAIGATKGDVDVVGLSIVGVETLNLTSNGLGNDLTVAGSLNSLTFGVNGADKLTAINVAGDSSLDLTLTNTSKAVTVASTQTGTAALKISGTVAKGSVIGATANADTIATSGAIVGTTGDFATYNAGAGADTITTTLAAINNTSAANGSLKIDGGDGIDTLSTDAGTYADANFQFLTNIEKITFTGGGALGVTTGGFFDTNFKAAGVTFTDTAWAGATLQSIDASTFTGVTKATIKQSDTDAGASLVLKTGSAADVITVETGGALTSIANVIATGDGADTVTLTAAALDAAGKFTVNLGNGNDTFTAAYAGAGLLDLTGGKGADSLTLGANHTAGKFVVNQGNGDSGTYAALNVASGVISTTSFDVISNIKAGDKINLSSYTTGTAFVNTAIAATSLTPTLADNSFTIAKGTYNASAGTFTYSASGADGLAIYDSNASTTAQDYEAVVLVGMNALTSATTAGMITV